MNALLNAIKSRTFVKILVCVLASIVFTAGFPSTMTFAQGDDGIPGNCPYTRGVFYAQNLIPRYEGGALALVDWTTGGTVRTIPTTVTGEQFQIGIWSPECQYLSGSFGSLDNKGVMSWDTALWDVVNNTQIATFEDARIIPYPLTWDTNSTQILVETRFGAYLWKFGANVWLTSEVDGNARSFRQGTVRWDYSANQISGILTLPPFGTAVYDMSSGTLLSVTDQFGRAQNSTYLFDVKANPDNERYPCRQRGYSSWYMDGVRVSYQPENKRIVMTDEGTRELLHVVLEDVETLRYDGESWLPGCKYLMIELGRYGLQETLIVDMTTSERVFSVKNTLIRSFLADPSGTFAVVSTRFGSSLLHIPSGTQHILNPQPLINTLGTGSVYTFGRLDWDLANNQVRMRDYNSLIRVYDLTTGYLVTMLDSEGNLADEGVLTAAREQIEAPYGCRFNIQYQNYNQRLVIKDSVTHDLIAVVEDNLPAEGFEVLGRSPDCHYIAGAVGTDEDMDTIVWDLNTLTRAGVFENAVKIPHPLDWAPYGGYVVVNTRDGGYLWHLPTDTRTKLNGEAIERRASYSYNYEGRYSRPYRQLTIRSFHYFEWDMSNGQLLAVPVDRPNVVIAYDLATGHPAAEYAVTEHTVAVKFLSYDDGRLLVYSDVSSGRLSDGRLALWNRVTGENIQLAMDFYVRPGYESSSYYDQAEPQFSPNSRFLMLTSPNYLYVWDFGALAGNTPHLPNVTIKVPGADTARFIDNSTIETVDITSTKEQRERRVYSRTSYHWDAATGALRLENSEELRRR